MFSFEILLKTRNFYFISIFLLLLIISFFFTQNTLDPDFGWHLKSGELIFQRGVPKVDWYSFTMSDFPWINHEWLTDVLIFKMFSFGGYKLVLLFFLFFAVLSFFIQIEKKVFWFYLFPLIFGFFVSLPFLGARPQLLTLFFISLLLKIIKKFLENSSSKIIFFLPLLFLLWVNLHGGFFAGLFILFLYSVLEIFKNTKYFEKILAFKIFENQYFQKRNIKVGFFLFFIFLFCFLFTFLNPYGIRIYEEVFRTIGDRNLSFSIKEWQPLIFSPVFEILYFAIFLALFCFRYRKVEFSELILILVFSIFSMLHTRHWLICILLSLPVFAQILKEMKKEITPQAKELILGGRKKYFVSFAVIGFLLFCLSSIFSSAKEFAYPSADAISFLKTLPLNENIFNEYGWGGYLIWKIPERKFFIDGRMPSWRKNGRYILSEYFIVKNGKDGFEDVLKKYNIKIILLKNKSQRRIAKENLPKFLKKNEGFLKFLGISFDKILEEKLIERGWKIIFEDSSALIFRKES